MYTHPFSKNSLKNATRAGDAGRYSIDLETELDELVSDIAQSIRDDTLNFSHKQIPVKDGRHLFQMENYKTVLSLRAAAASISKANHIRPRSRDKIVQGTLEALFDSTPSYVIRCDFSSFYENIDVGQVVEEIYTNTRTHPYIRKVLDGLKSNGIFNPDTPGIPRGLGLSAVLSEIRLKPFDEEIQKLPGVYRYFRFADDFVLFSLDNPEALTKQIKDLCGSDLKLNTRKTKTIEIVTSPDSDKKPCKTPPVQMDFLGYRFLISQGVRNRSSRGIRVTLSDNKIAKRKTRVLLTLKDFAKSGDVDLLTNRLRLLTSNMSIRRSGHSHGSNKTRVRTGIFYNYRACGSYNYSKGRPLLDTKKTVPELGQLDGFLYSLLWRPNSEFFNAIQSGLNADQKDQLRKLAFKKGFHNKMTIRLTRDQAAKARRVWRHA